MRHLDQTPLFTTGSFRAFEMGTADIPRLQRFYESNPQYHLMVGGEAPRPNEARDDFESLPPADWPFEKSWMLAFMGDDDAMVGMANVISSLFAQGIWHIGYLDVRRRHGVQIGKRVHTLRVMAKPLASGGLSEYLAVVARDRPESA